MHTLAFCSCIPRSGSTLLLNLLAQNPAIHATPTNDLSELFGRVRDTWMTQDAFKSQGLKALEPRMLGVLCGMLGGFYDSELAAGRVVIDKSRTWLRHIELLELVLGRRIKIIVPIRPIVDVVASFERLYRKAALTVPAYTGPLDGLRQTTVGRAQAYLGIESVLGAAINRLRDAIDRGLGDRLLLVPFRHFTNNPLTTANWLTRELGAPEFAYDVNNVQQLTHEDDGVYGLDLHQIHEGPIKPAGGPTWRGILKDEFVHWLEQEYADLDRLANRLPDCLRA